MILNHEAYVFDFECGPQHCLLGLQNLDDENEIAQFSNCGIGRPFQEFSEWFKAHKDYYFVGFNNRCYDNKLLRLILNGYHDSETLFEASKTAIASDDFTGRVEQVDGEVNIDLLALVGGKNARIGSLKECAAKLHMPDLLENPHPWDKVLNEEELLECAAYNLVDLKVTAGVTDCLRHDILARIKLGEEYKVRLVNAHDASIAEKVMAKILFTGRAEYPQMTSWSLHGSELVKGFDFDHPELTALRERISKWNISFDVVTEMDNGEPKKYMEMTKFSDAVKVDDTSYTIGVGGLHSEDDEAVFVADETYELWDCDVASFYPTLFLNYKLAPNHLPGKAFLVALKTLRQRRLDAKKSGDKALADGLKIAINSVFGKSAFPYSWLCDPTVMTKCTVFGQLTLLSIIDQLSGIDGVQVVSANTDGLILRLHKDLSEEVRTAIDAWANSINLSLDWAQYNLYLRRDVNNYLGVHPDGSLKAKGAFGYDRNDLRRKAVHSITIDAAQKYFISNVPVAETVRACQDITKFIDYFRASHGWKIMDDKGNDYGGIVRWYVGKQGRHLDKIKVADNSKIQIVERGAVVINQLPLIFPGDVDYEYYIGAAEKLVKSITEPDVHEIHNIPMAELSAEQREQHKNNYEMVLADPTICGDIDLTRYHKGYAEIIRGNKYDTMKHLLASLWLSQCGRMTRGDLLWCAQTIDASDGYFSGNRKRTLCNMSEWIARSISAFPLPRTVEDHAKRAMTWALEHVEEAKSRRKMYHHDLFNSTYVNGEALRKYANSGNLYRLACHVAAAIAKHKRNDEDEKMVAKVLHEVEAAGLSHFVEKVKISSILEN